MAGYRFCRSDDVPLLVAAHNACWTPHFGAASAITVADFSRGVRELGLWASSCMVAFEGDEPIGVLLAAKRDGEANWVWRIAVRPGSERQGHGRHLLASLGDKAAILGPPAVLAEIPTAWTGARTFFERAGFVAESTYLDLVLDTASGSTPVGDPRAARMLVPVTLDELIEHGAFDGGARSAWSGTIGSLRVRAGELTGVAFATDRIEAWLLHRDDHASAEREIVALGAPGGAMEPRLLGILLDHVRADGRRLRVPLLDDRAPAAAALESLGFRRDGEYVGYVIRRA